LTDVKDFQKRRKEMGVLTYSPAVMIWRRVTDLAASAKFSTKMLAWPQVGNNEYAVVSDTGNVLLGQWAQALCPPDGGCSKLDFDKFELVSNPGSELVAAARSVNAAMSRIRAATKLPIRSSFNGSTSFVDQDGNHTALIRFKGSFKGRSGRKLNSLLKAGAAGGAKGRSLANPVVGYTLLVTDLKTSARFYKDVLGLNVLGTDKHAVTFDLGTMILTLKPEPALGLVRSLNKRHRLEGDWLVFHVKDIEADVKALKSRGVTFPKGIEDSVHGRGAYFTDPDGYSYGLWLPPDKPDKIDYFPELSRILDLVTWQKK
jgi:catechol 2,3-dioxygenase-like lactoylglutathione lyase family enzyme